MMTRRRFLALGVGLGVLCIRRFATATGCGSLDDSPYARMVDVERGNSLAVPSLTRQDALDVEEVGLATTNTAVQNTTALTTAVAANPAHIYCFSRGDYHVDNSGTGPAGVFLWNMSGGFVFTGGSRLVFSASTKRGIVFQNCTAGFIVDGFSSIYSTTPTARNRADQSPGPLNFYSCTHPQVRNIRVYGSPGAAVYFSGCDTPQVENVYIENSWGDGVQFQDCRNPGIFGLVCEQVGDDGLAFYKRSTAAANVEGGFASHIMVRKTETSGISVWGQPNVVIEDFCIEDTNGAALQVRYATRFDTAYIRNVRFAHGRLENCGTYQRKGGAAYFTDGYGIHVHSLPSGVAAPAADVTFEDIDIVNAKESSVYIELNKGKVTLKNIWCKGGAQTAGNLGGAVVASAPIATLDDVEVSDVPGTGFRFYDFGKLILGHLVAHDVSQRYTHRRAFSSDGSGVVLNGNLQITNDQAPSTTDYQIPRWTT
jgi:hypothetical protein